MKEDEIRRLVKIVEESNIGELEITRWGRTIKISKGISGVPAVNNSGSLYHAAPPQPLPAVLSGQSTPAETTPEPVPVKTASGVEMKSPMVGTFYLAPAPDADAYVEVGKVVKKGQVLCIIEAMKLMNEIESEYDGKIVEILVENAQPVEYNQPLFLVEPA